jgi:hypothetical protein
MAFPAADPTLAMADPAEDVTLERPSAAFDAACDVFSFAVLAASAVVEALRNVARRRETLGCRSTIRDADDDIAKVERGNWPRWVDGLMLVSRLRCSSKLSEVLALRVLALFFSEYAGATTCCQAQIVALLCSQDRPKKAQPYSPILKAVL